MVLPVTGTDATDREAEANARREQGLANLPRATLGVAGPGCQFVVSLLSSLCRAPIHRRDQGSSSATPCSITMCSHRGNPLSLENRGWIAGLTLPGAAREQLDVALAIIDALDLQLVPLHRELRAIARKQPSGRPGRHVRMIASIGCIGLRLRIQQEPAPPLAESSHDGVDARSAARDASCGHGCVATAAVLLHIVWWSTMRPWRLTVRVVVGSLNCSWICSGTPRSW